MTHCVPKYFGAPRQSVLPRGSPAIHPSRPTLLSVPACLWGFALDGSSFLNSISILFSSRERSAALSSRSRSAALAFSLRSASFALFSRCAAFSSRSARLSSHSRSYSLSRRLSSSSISLTRTASETEPQ